jgi:homoserine kinase
MRDRLHQEIRLRAHPPLLRLSRALERRTRVPWILSGSGSTLLTWARGSVPLLERQCRRVLSESGVAGSVRTASLSNRGARVL